MTPPITPIVVARSPEAMINGVAVSPTGRLFSSFPRWTDRQTPGVAEARADGTFVPIPGGDWNEWAPGLPTDDRFVAVHSIFADRANNLWVVDDAAPRQASHTNARPKIVQIDLATNRVAHIYRLDGDAAPPGTVLGHVRVDAEHLYVTDSGHGAVIVIDRASGRARRLLQSDPRALEDRSVHPMIEGLPFQRSDGSRIIVHLNLLEIMEGWLYFTCLFGPMLRRIPVAALADAYASPAHVAGQIEDVTPIPPCAGIMSDRRGTLYLSSFTENGVRRWHNGRLELLVSHPRISFPNEGMVGPDGALYIPASQVHRIAAHQPDRVSRVQLPWEVLRLDLAD